MLSFNYVSANSNICIIPHFIFMTVFLAIVTFFFAFFLNINFDFILDIVDAILLRVWIVLSSFKKY